SPSPSLLPLLSHCPACLPPVIYTLSLHDALPIWITIFSHVACIQTGNSELQILDTPGHIDFAQEMEETLSVLDYAILVVSASERSEERRVGKEHYCSWTGTHKDNMTR